MAHILPIEGKATIHRAEQYRQACLAACSSGEPWVEIHWAGASAIDTSVLQLLLALGREKEIRSIGEPVQAVADTLAMAGFDASLRPITWNPR